MRWNVTHVATGARVGELEAADYAEALGAAIVLAGKTSLAPGKLDVELAKPEECAWSELIVSPGHMMFLPRPTCGVIHRGTVLSPRRVRYLAEGKEVSPMVIPMPARAMRSAPRKTKGAKRT